MTSPIPLRERLAGMLACRCDPAWTERKLHDPRCLEELQDDVLENVRNWLREEAHMSAYANAIMRKLDRLADAIDKELSHDR